MNATRDLKKYSTILFLFFLLFQFSSMSVLADHSKQVEQLLAQMKTYNFGQDREILTQLSEIVRAAADSPDEIAQIQPGLLKFLASDTPFAAKQFICRQLAIIGNEEAVPVLSRLLMKTETSDIARFALENISGEVVDKALRKALSKASGEIKIGIINTIGNRRDAKATKALGKLISHSDGQVALVAVNALGKISDEKVLKILMKAKDSTSGLLQTSVLDAILKGADQLVIQGNLEEAAKIYETLYHVENPNSIRLAALRGVVKTAGEQDVQVILKALKQEPPSIQTVAINLIRELPKTREVSILAAELPNLPETNAIQLLAALGDRGDVSVREDVLKMVRNGHLEIRIAVLEALVPLGTKAEVALFTGVAANGEAKEKEVARKCLAHLSRPGVNETIIAQIPAADSNIKVELIKSMGSRQIETGVDLLLQTATDTDSKVRSESFKVLELIAEPQHQAKLTDLLIQEKTGAVRKRAEKALVANTRKIPDQTQQIDIILQKLARISDIEARSSLLKVLGRIGNEKALPVLLKALESQDNSIQTAAIYALSDWPNPKPLDILLKLAQTSPDERHQVLALRGFIRLLGFKSERTPAESIELHQTAMKLAEHPNEQKMVLASLTQIPHLAALEMAMRYVSDPNLKEEAEVAVVKMANPVRYTVRKKIREMLEQVIQSSTNERVKKDAKDILKRINRK